MLDLFGILFSSVIMFLVILRAIQMDRTQPWFRPPKSGGVPKLTGVHGTTWRGSK